MEAWGSAWGDGGAEGAADALDGGEVEAGELVVAVVLEGEGGAEFDFWGVAEAHCYRSGIVIYG